MGTKGLEILAGVAKGLNEASGNLMNLQLAKYKLQRDQQISDLDIKTKKLELQKAEMLFDPEQIRGQKELLDAQIKMQKSAYNMANIAIGNAEKQNKEAHSTYSNQLSTIGQVIDLGEMGLVDPNKVDQKKVLENKIAMGTATPEETARYDQLRTTVEVREKGLPADAAGKLAMVGQAENDLSEAEKLLFPGGKFSPKMAFETNFPGGGVPATEGRQVFSKVLNAVNAKLRIETGAQANPSEVKNILQRFLPTTRDSNETATDKFRRLKEFMSNTKAIIDPTGKYKYVTTGSEMPHSLGNADVEIKDKYNLLREKGLSSEEAKKILGIKE